MGSAERLGYKVLEEHTIHGKRVAETAAKIALDQSLKLLKFC